MPAGGRGAEGISDQDGVRDGEGSPRRCRLNKDPKEQETVRLEKGVRAEDEELQLTVKGLHLAGAEQGWTTLALSALSPAPTHLCSLCSSSLVYPPPAWAQKLPRDALEAQGPERGSPTCSLGHHHLGFAASAIAFHGVGGYRDRVGGLRLQVCDDHLLWAGVGISDATRAARPPPHAGTSQADTGPSLWAETCTRPHAQTPTHSTFMLRWAHVA